MNGRILTIKCQTTTDVTVQVSENELSLFLKQNPNRERLTVRSRRRSQILDCLFAVIDQNENFGPHITRYRVIIGAVTLFLEDDERIGK